MEFERAKAKVVPSRRLSFLADNWLVGHERTWMGAIMLLSDLVSLCLAAGLALFIWSFVRSDLHPAHYFRLLPVLLLFVLVYALSGLYRGAGVNPVDELRSLSLGTSGTFLGISTLSFWLRNVEEFSRASYGLAWIFALVLVPVLRKAVRSLFVGIGLWGERVAIIGYGKQGARLVDFLQDNPKLGFRPVVILDGFRRDNPPAYIPFYKVENIPNPQKAICLKGVKTAFLIPSELPSGFLNRIVTDQWNRFYHLIMIPDDQMLGSVWVMPHDLGGLLGLEVRQNLLSLSQQYIKRAMDLVLVIGSVPILLPVFGVLALFIRLDSPGPIFYRQKRIGYCGKEFRVWKFRTMLDNAEELLEQHLDNCAEHQEEWQRTRKLKDDPRVTRMGKVLRRLSLDELPQLLNVLNGEMSLVGPRPIVCEELDLYGTGYRLYSRVKPGLTGLWQVSGRNDTTYCERVQMDEYYVLNWSVWLDMYILQQTVKAVISGHGAY